MDDQSSKLANYSSWLVKNSLRNTKRKVGNKFFSLIRKEFFKRVRKILKRAKKCYLKVYATKGHGLQKKIHIPLNF
jgi:hypothetical protein